MYSNLDKYHVLICHQKAAMVNLGVILPGPLSLAMDRSSDDILVVQDRHVTRASCFHGRGKTLQEF